MNVEYTWTLHRISILWNIMTGKICRQFILLLWTPFIGQFIYPVGGEGMSKGGLFC